MHKRIARWWTARAGRHDVATIRAAAHQAEEAAAAQQRVLGLARGQREPLPDWTGPTLVEGLPLLTFGQRRQYRVRP